MPRKPKRRFGGNVDWSDVGNAALKGIGVLATAAGPLSGLAFMTLDIAESERQRRDDKAARDAYITERGKFTTEAIAALRDYWTAQANERWIQKHTLTDKDVAEITAKYKEQFEKSQAGAVKDAEKQNAILRAAAQQRADNKASMEAAKRADALAASQQRLTNQQSQSAARIAASSQTLGLIQSETASVRNAALTNARIIAQEAQMRLQAQRQAQQAAAANALQSQQLYGTLAQRKKEQEAARMGANIVNTPFMRRLPPIVSETGVRR